MLDIEATLLSSWPALTTAYDGRWLLRAAEGFTGRANSVVFLDRDDGRDAAGRMDRAERFYRQRGLTPAFRQTPMMSETVARELAARGYRAEDHSAILAGALPDVPADAGGEGGFRIECDIPDATAFSAPERWLDSVGAASARSAANRATLAAMMRRIACDAAFLTLDLPETPLEESPPEKPADASLLAAVHGGWLTVHLVATLPRARRRGCARALMREACRWGRKRGADRLWIAVETDNLPALSLYRGLGLAAAYDYCYWRKHD